MLDSVTERLLADVGDAAARVGAEVDAAPHEVAIVALFDRCRSTFGAVRTLLAAGFAHEAVMLGRPLFTESLMLAEFARVDEPERAELVVGWWLKGLADLEGILREGEAQGDDAVEDLAKVARRRAQLRRYATKRGVGARHWKPDEKSLAATHMRRREYLDFRLTHHFVHGSAMSVEERTSKLADETLAVGGPHADLTTWAIPAGLFAAASMTHATFAVCSVFGWPVPDTLNRLTSRIDASRRHLGVEGDATSGPPARSGLVSCVTGVPLPRGSEPPPERNRTGAPPDPRHLAHEMRRQSTNPGAPRRNPQGG